MGGDLVDSTYMSVCREVDFCGCLSPDISVISGLAHGYSSLSERPDC